MVMAQSLFKVCQQREPKATIDVVAPSWSAPILARMPEVRRTISLDVAHGEWAFQKRWQLVSPLKGSIAERLFCRAPSNQLWSL